LIVSCAPARSHAATIRRASPQVVAIGFSQWIALTPAAAQATTISACKCPQAQTLTISGRTSASIAR
jgi:hypothetical protein